jgi:hypothetical protein
MAEAVVPEALVFLLFTINFSPLATSEDWKRDGKKLKTRRVVFWVKKTTATYTSSWCVSSLGFWTFFFRPIPEKNLRPSNSWEYVFPSGFFWESSPLSTDPCREQFDHSVDLDSLINNYLPEFHPPSSMLGTIFASYQIDTDFFTSIINFAQTNQMTKPQEGIPLAAGFSWLKSLILIL